MWGVLPDEMMVSCTKARVLARCNDALINQGNNATIALYWNGKPRELTYWDLYVLCLCRISYMCFLNFLLVEYLHMWLFILLFIDILMVFKCALERETLMNPSRTINGMIALHKTRKGKWLGQNSVIHPWVLTYHSLRSTWLVVGVVMCHLAILYKQPCEHASGVATTRSCARMILEQAIVWGMLEFRAWKCNENRRCVCWWQERMPKMFEKYNF